MAPLRVIITSLCFLQNVIDTYEKLILIRGVHSESVNKIFNVGMFETFKVYNELFVKGTAVT